MSRIIPIRDLEKMSEIPRIYEFYAKLDEAEEDIAAGWVSDAHTSLGKLREKHGCSATASSGVTPEK